MGQVIAVSRSATPHFGKSNESIIRLVAGLGVMGDAHLGETVQHQSRVIKDPTQPNLRQVHLIHAELFEELRPRGFDLAPGVIGENITTRDIDLLGLPAGSFLHLGASAVVQVTGLRNPCRQIENFQPGLLAALLGRDAQGNITRKSGVMGIVIAGGDVQPGDPITVELPPLPHQPLARV
jgi:MOSC domain-containing protein YiiM